MYSVIYRMVKKMYISQEQKEIRKLSKFLSDMYVPHYVYGSSLHILGECVYVNFEEPMEIRVNQNDNIMIRVIKDCSIVYIEIWKDLDGVTYNIETSDIKVIYNDGELEIHFSGE